MPRMTLYVPDNLKAQMDEIAEAINWSAVAQEAFKQAVAVSAIKREPANMEQVIERLRASKARVDRRSRESGRECGKRWAGQAAEYDELKRVADWTRMQGAVIPFTVEAFKQLIDPMQKMDRYAWHNFWLKHGEGDVNDTFAEGFINGAAEIFSEIENQLR